MLRSRFCALVSLSFVLLPLSASANPGELAGYNDDPLVWGGQNASLCAWPTTVAVQGGGSLCTGTLVMPNLVMYAAHCGGGNKTVHFGENTVQGKKANVEFCQTNAGYSGQGTDWAFCKLAVPVDLPATPIAFGCEEDVLTIGTDIFVVGFGNNNGQSGAGTKRWAETIVTSQVAGNRFNVGGGGEATVCSGDSGGPVFKKLSDGTFHTYGIASTKNSGTCDSALGTYSFAPGAAKWIEENSGVDVTPCHDVNTGNWQPGPECGDFYTGGSMGTGTWSNWCGGTPSLEWSATCGPSFGNEMENNPPTVTITAPAEDLCVTPDSNPYDIMMEANDDSGYVTQIQLQINGDLQDIIDMQAPWQFSNVQFPVGTWEVVAVAEDFWGNVGESAPVTVQMVEDLSECTSGDDDGGEDEEGGGESDEGGDEGEDTGVGEEDDGAEDGTGEGGMLGDEGEVDSGCSCSASNDASPMGTGLGLGLLALLGLVRRRTA